jgi:GGDEF domain-containing protein
LRKHKAPQYRVFRIGGDEFAVLSEGVSEKRVIERLLALKKRLGENGDISLSKGYSMIKDNPEKAFKYADDMLYADKLSRKLKDISTKNI